MARAPLAPARAVVLRRRLLWVLALVLAGVGLGWALMCWLLGGLIGPTLAMQSALVLMTPEIARAVVVLVAAAGIASLITTTMAACALWGRWPGVLAVVLASILNQASGWAGAAFYALLIVKLTEAAQAKVEPTAGHHS